MKNKKKKSAAKSVKKTIARKPARKAARKPAPKSARKSIGQRVQLGIDAVAAGVASLFTGRPTDLISAIEKDHEGLRQFISVLKDTKRDMTERRRAYELFSSLLKSHTISEEKAVYKPLETKANHELVIRIEEGYVEHNVAKKVMADMEKTDDTNVWSAHANVLAELVAHHLDEEEREMFPLMKKQIPKNLEAELIVSYLELRAETQVKVVEKNAGVLNVFR